MKKSKKLMLTALSVALVAIIAIFGTVAYLMDTDSDVNVMTLGNVDIVQHEQQVGADGTTLEPFEQKKGLYPGTEISKIVTVENTGKSDAYFRTLIAFEDVPNSETFGVDFPIGEFSGYTWSWGAPEATIVIGSVTYQVYEAVYNGVLKAGETSPASLTSVEFADTATNEDMAALGETYDILVLSQAVQIEGFADAATALDTAFGDVGEENATEWFTAIAPKDVAGNEDAKDALTQDKENIVVILADDVTYDVAAWANDAMGGNSTKSITIYGNGHTITFNQTNSDWSNIVTENDATLTIVDAHITNSGHNDGPWNRHDLNFACPVVLENVTSDKALAFKAGATLKNVTIDDANTSDTYAIWIQPKGQTVSLDGCTIDMLDCTDGRGIKIDEQYVDAPQKVILNVSNTTFKTEEKSAILVKSVAGADITLNNVDISGVVADPINEVWVDEASKAYADLVTVTGGSKVVEGTFTFKTISTADELLALCAKTLTGNNGVAEEAAIILTSDIDMQNAAFSAIIAQYGDKLTIVGNGHKISNVQVVSGANDNTTGQASMFYAYPNSTLTVSDLTLENITVTADANATGYAAAVVGYCEGAAILNNVDVINGTVIGVKSSGMLVGHLSGSLVATDCDLSGSVTLDDFAEEADGHYAGEYIGTLAGPATLTSCTANVTVSGNLNKANLKGVYGRKTTAGSLIQN